MESVINQIKNYNRYTLILGAGAVILVILLFISPKIFKQKEIPALNIQPIPLSQIKPHTGKVFSANGQIMEKGHIYFMVETSLPQGEKKQIKLFWNNLTKFQAPRANASLEKGDFFEEISPRQDLDVGQTINFIANADIKENQEVLAREVIVLK